MEAEPTEQSLGYLFGRVLERYRYARQNLEFGGHHEIYGYFDSVKTRFEASAPVRQRPSLRVVASYGKGNWATIPWISFLDSRETTSTQRGTYVVYLFREDGDGFYLTLAQGVTDTERELGAAAFSTLIARAETIRREIPDLGEHGFELSSKSDLGTSHKKGKLYEASTIAFKYYEKADMPSDDVLVADLEHVLGAYHRVVERGMTRPTGDDDVLALVGTWRTVKADMESAANHIREHGAWASPWSFRLKEEAEARLIAPFWLYINGGGGLVIARARVSAVAAAPDTRGMTTPWPEFTEHEWLGITRFGPSAHEVIKTWFRITAIEMVVPFRATELRLAPGLSTLGNLLNQNAFGYVYEKADLQAEVNDAPAAVDGIPQHMAAPDFEWLAAESLLDAALLEEMAQSLSSATPQIMLVGPPGTSKTWVAKKLAEFVTGGRARAVRTVQFHPSYTYESFIEGLRPKSGSSGISFELLPGAVLELVETMTRAGHLNDVRFPYVLILDEANRANLPRVLGELLFLFEYRDESIRLQYSSEFRLPKNLYFIATMNTADRSIRSIDAALRRRFDVFELGPDGAVLDRYFRRNGQPAPEITSGLVALNAQLESDIDRHHTIGHSFFMKSDLGPGQLRKIWERRIYPLVEEYFFDQPDIAKAYIFERFWPNAS
jgi:MoxR-like ATPase